MASWNLVPISEDLGMLARDEATILHSDEFLGEGSKGCVSLKCTSSEF